MFPFEIFIDDKSYKVIVLKDIQDLPIEFCKIAKNKGYKKFVYSVGSFGNVGYKNKKNSVMTIKEYEPEELVDERERSISSAINPTNAKTDKPEEQEG